MSGKARAFELLCCRRESSSSSNTSDIGLLPSVSVCAAPPLPISLFKSSPLLHQGLFAAPSRFMTRSYKLFVRCSTPFLTSPLNLLRLLHVGALISYNSPLWISAPASSTAFFLFISPPRMRLILHQCRPLSVFSRREADHACSGINHANGSNYLGASERRL